MSIINITKAVRKGAHIIVTLYGYSSSGKTLSALLLTRGLVGDKGRMCMIDTETGRGMIYAQAVPGGYDYCELTPPFTPERCTEAVQEVEKAGYDALIFDSSSAEWQGIGGILEMADASGYTGLVKWAGPKAKHKRWMNALLNSRMHIILAVRAKEKLVQIGKGKEATIVSEGMVAIQEKGFVYDTTVQLFMHHEPKLRATYTVEKCPGDLLSAFPDGQKITVETGHRIAEWIAGGAPVDHDLETLRRTGESQAERGTEALKAWWSSPETKPHQKRLLAHMDNLKSIAATADADAAEAAKSEVGAPADNLADPFAEPRKPVIVKASTGEPVEAPATQPADAMIARMAEEKQRKTAAE